MKREIVDFHVVEPHQRKIDSRLINWGRWCTGTSAPAVCPQFRMVPPPPRTRADAQATGQPVDEADATKIAKGVAHLPEMHRASINWAYVKPCNPQKTCQALGLTKQGLYQLLRDARQMLINRAV